MSLCFAVNDFLPTDATLVFNATLREICTVIPVSVDFVVEPEEIFEVRLRSDDMLVNILDEFTRVTIVDTTRK